ncbi:MAG: hypothetical protein COA83_09340 [Methylophaga sp.]|nr:MAG: hypothetical protein COA83_09340 [Methylophaga sp.]
MAKITLTLVLPGLANILQQQINANILPTSLKTILLKAQFKADGSNLTRLLFNLFSEDPIDTADLPYTQLLNTKTPILCATPCYLHADRDRLLLFANEQPLTERESSDLIDELQELFEEFNAKLIQHETGEILLQLTTLPKVQFSALADVDGKAVTHYLPAGEDKGNWIRLWNEIQMKLYESPFNQKREASGKMPINSLWFWGMGEFNAKHNYWQSVQGEHLILKQLVQAASNSLATGRHLQLLDELDLEADWQQQLEQWEQDTLKPALQQCRKAQINQLELIIPDHGKYVLTPLRSWKFW